MKLKINRMKTSTRKSQKKRRKSMLNAKSIWLMNNIEVSDMRKKDNEEKQNKYQI